MPEESIKNSNRECRLCLQNSEVYFNLLEGNFPQMLKDLTSLEIREDDDYPKFGCTTCIFEMQSAVKVRNRILECYKKLVELKNAKVSEGTSKTLGTIYILAKVAKNTITEPVAILTSVQPYTQVNNIVNPVIGTEISKLNETISKTSVEIKKNVETSESNVCSRSFNLIKTEVYTEHNYAKPFDGEAEKCNSNTDSKKVLTIEGNYEFINEYPTPDDPNITGIDLGDNSVEKSENDVEKKQICRDCGESFRNKRAFEFHITKHNKIRCKRCYLIIDKSQVQIHKDFHDNDPRTCNQCGKIMKNERYLRKHIFSVHMPRIYATCDHCPEGFRLKSELKQHLKEKHNDVMGNVCSNAVDEADNEDCTVEIPDDQSESEEKIPHFLSEKRYICPDCDANCHSQRSFDAHISTHNKSRCKKCSLVIETENLENHRDSHMNDPKVCHLCGQVTKNEMAFKRHLARIHSSKVNFKCNHCSEGFSMKLHFNKHMREKHPEVLKKKEGPRVCDVCGKVCISKPALMHHIYYVHKLQPNKFKCDQCDSGFRTKTEREKHKFAVHDGIRNNTCHICGKNFVHPWDAERHIRVTHMNIRPHKCEICHKGFSSPHGVRIHMLKHTKERPFKCNICGKGLTQMQKLRYHLKVVHNIRESEDYSCNICNKRFNSSLGMKIHLRSHVNSG